MLDDLSEANTEAAESGAESVEKKQRPYGKKNPDALIEERQRRLYRRQLDGMPARALVHDHATREGVSVATAWRDYAAIQKWGEQDWQTEREKMVSRIQSMRLRCIEGAIRAKQFGTAQLLLRDLGAVVAEVTPEALAAAAPSLSITVEDRRAKD